MSSNRSFELPNWLGAVVFSIALSVCPTANSQTNDVSPIQLIQSPATGSWEENWEIYQRLGKQGDYYSAIEFANAAINAATIEFGARHLTVLAGKNDLAFFYELTGRFKESEQVYTEVLRASEIELGWDDPFTLLVKDNLAAVYQKQGKYSESLLLFREVIEQRSVALGEDHEDTLASLSNLAWTYDSLGRLEDAKELYEQVLQKKISILGDEHIETLTTMGNLAQTYTGLGMYEDAGALFHQTITTMQRVLGWDHPDTLSVLDNFAHFMMTIGSYESATRLANELLVAKRRRLGREHPETLRTTNLLATLLALQTKYEESLELQIKLVAVSPRIFGEHHPRRALYLANLATLLYDSSPNKDAAIFYQKQAVNIIQLSRYEMSALEEETQDAFLQVRLIHYTTLQKWLIEAGRLAEAEQVGRMIKEQEFFEFIRRRAGPNDDPRNSLNDLTNREKEWAERLDSWSDRPNKVAVELAAFKTKSNSGDSLTPFESAQLKDLESEYSVAYASYKANVDKWLASVRSLPDETIQAEARALDARYHDSLQEEVAEIGDDVAAVQIVAFEESLHFFLITPGAFKHIEAPVKRRDLNEAIFAARSAIRPNENTGYIDSDPTPQLQALYEILFRPLEQELRDAGSETLMLNLQGSIRYVPFAALHDGSNYLIEKFELSLFTPAARTRFEPSEDLNTATGFGVSLEHAPFLALPGVTEEIASIFGTDTEPGILDGPSFLDPDFTLATLEAELENERPIVHIASHFYMQPGNDSNSFLLLGDGSYLTLAEINESVALQFRGVELLTLSACSTALSTQGDFDVESGTGVEVEGFGVLAQRKGADAVIASLWDVADDSTAKLMADLYTNLSSGGMNKAEALRAAQVELLENPRTRHPYFWAPFILMGNWK